MKISLNINILLIVALAAMAGMSCSSRKNKIDRSEKIPEKDLTSIIADIYITDGVLTMPSVHRLNIPNDSLGAYKDVIEKHGYTKEAMDKTMRFYFIKKPKKLIKIYDKVLAKLSELESVYDREASIILTRTSNLWKGEDFYIFPDPSGTDSTNFDIRIPYPGKYIISFTATLYPDDQTSGTRMIAYTCHPDSLITGKKHYINTFGYIKDGHPHYYYYTINALDVSHMRVRGRLYDFDNYPEKSGMHLVIEKISFTSTSG